MSSRARSNEREQSYFAMIWREGPTMSIRKLITKRHLSSATAAVIEQLESRRMLSYDCRLENGTTFAIYAEDNVNNVITVFWDATNSQLYVKEGTTEVCRETG